MDIGAQVRVGLYRLHVRPRDDVRRFRGTERGHTTLVVHCLNEPIRENLQQEGLVRAIPQHPVHHVVDLRSGTPARPAAASGGSPRVVALVARLPSAAAPCGQMAHCVPSWRIAAPSASQRTRPSPVRCSAAQATSAGWSPESAAYRLRRTGRSRQRALGAVAASQRPARPEHHSGIEREMKKR